MNGRHSAYSRNFTTTTNVTESMKNRNLDDDHTEFFIPIKKGMYAKKKNREDDEGNLSQKNKREKQKRVDKRLKGFDSNGSW